MQLLPQTTRPLSGWLWGWPGMLCPLSDAVWVPQVLGLPAESGGLLDEFHEVYHQFALPPLPLHRRLCSPRDAAVRRQVSTRELSLPKSRRVSACRHQGH